MVHRNENYWRSCNTSGGADQNGNANRPSFIGLAHELGHADNAKDGYSNYMNADPDNYPGYTLDEHYAMHIENAVRSEYGIPLRSSYSTYPNGAAFMRAIIPGTSLEALTGYDFGVNNRVQIPYATQ